MNLRWEFHHPRASLYHVGYIGQSLLDNTDAKAAAQINDLYHFGGWRPFAMSEWSSNWQGKPKETPLPWLRYPGDPKMEAIAAAVMYHPGAPSELICVYQSDWWAIFQLDGSFEVCRLD